MNRVNILASIEVMERMNRIITGKYKTKDKKATKKHRERGLIRVGDLRGYTNRIPILKEIAIEHPDRDPLGFVLEALERDGIVERLCKDPITGDTRKMIRVHLFLTNFMDVKKSQISDMEHGLM